MYTSPERQRRERQQQQALIKQLPRDMWSITSAMGVPPSAAFLGLLVECGNRPTAHIGTFNLCRMGRLVMAQGVTEFYQGLPELHGAPSVREHRDRAAYADLTSHFQRATSFQKATHVVTKAALATLPPDLLGEQIDYLLAMGRHTEDRWQVHLLPPHAPTPDQINHSFTLVGEGDATAAYTESYVSVTDDEGVLTQSSTVNQAFYPAGNTIQAPRYRAAFNDILAHALPPAETRDALLDMRRTIPS